VCGALFPSIVRLPPPLPPTRFAKFLGILTLESFASASLGLAVGSVAPSTEAALAIGPAVMVVFIVFGGYYANADNVPVALRCVFRPQSNP
jgi:ABC-type transport system involved in multi-copper enzyme maturation permease subunit